MTAHSPAKEKKPIAEKQGFFVPESSPEMPETVNDNQDEFFQTKRAMSQAIDDVLYQKFPVLDKGFIRVVDYMGNDTAVTQAARVSYGKGTKAVSKDKGLINYLMRHRHTTPFEMCEIKFHVKLPIFIARQWIRHRTANVNEYSARYSVLSNEFYVPEPEQLAVQSTANMQGRGQTLTASESERVLDILKTDAEMCYGHYKELLNQDEDGNVLDENRSGLTRELARMNLTMNYYTEWYWKIDLHNLFHFISLRADSHAQYEIQEYAKVLAELTQKWVPFSYEAFVKYRQNAVSLSEPAVNIVKQLISGKKIDPDHKGMSAREWKEFLESFQLNEDDILSS